MSQENVVVTGGSGLLGVAIKEEISRKPDWCQRKSFKFLSSQNGDLTDFHSAEAIFNEFKPNYVINLAAQVGGLYDNMSRNHSFYLVNSKINQNVLQLAHSNKVKKCISCLSTCIFPAKVPRYPIDETMIHLGSPHLSNVGYSIAKRQIDLLNTLYNGLNRLNQTSSLFTSFIPTNIYGCHDNFKPEQSHVIPALIHKAHFECALRTDSGPRELRVSGSGCALRQFIFAPDLARLILWCLEEYDQEIPIILCPDEIEEYTIKQVAEMIAQIFSQRYQLELNVKFDLSRSDGQLKKTATNKMLRNLNPNFEFTPLKKGLEQVIDWYCNNYPNLRC